MEDKLFYLKHNVQLEPLVNQWYAWPHLIAPATAAMHLTNSHIKIMKSFVMAPQVHVMAVKNPSLRGGPFLDLPASRSSELGTLLENTIKEQSHMIELAQAIKALNGILLNEATGHSLEGMYKRVPEALKGYVELVYDLNNQPAMRLIEPLLYNSDYYDPSSQSFSLSIAEEDDRPFAFSTPRLEDDNHLHLRIPFKEESIDELFRMRHVKQSFGYIKEALGIDAEQDSLFRSFLTETPPAAPARYDGGVRIRYFGHACLLIEAKGVCIMTDPLVSYRYDSETYRFTYADLPEQIDFVLLTHTHSDHVVFESLLQLRHKIKTVIVPRCGGGALEDPSLKLVLNHIGFDDVIELDEMQTIKISGGSITGIPFLGEHGDLCIRSKTAHLIRLAEKSILCAADSANLEPKLYEHVYKMTGAVDVLFLGMECDGAPMTWLYGGLLGKPLERKLDQSRRLCGSDFQRGMDIVDQLRCKQVYVYAMGQEPWLGFITSIKYTDESKPLVESNKLVRACRDKGILSERLYVIKEIFLKD